MEIVPSLAALADKIIFNANFQRACNRYAHSGGTSEAIAVAAIKALEELGKFVPHDPR